MMYAWSAGWKLGLLLQIIVRYHRLRITVHYPVRWEEARDDMEMEPLEGLSVAVERAIGIKHPDRLDAERAVGVEHPFAHGGPAVDKAQDGSVGVSL
jgi:hypothetical protein